MEGFNNDKKERKGDNTDCISSNNCGLANTCRNKHINVNRRKWSNNTSK